MAIVTRERGTLLRLIPPIVLILGGAIDAAAQTEPFRIDESRLASLHWRSLGPAVAGGRITDIEIDPRRPSTVYIGAASGGVFRSHNHGTTWEPIFDGAANLSIGDIAIAPSDPRILWVGTGEANNRNSSPWGEGVYRSPDGGESWQLVGLEETRHIGRILIHPSNPDVVWIAAVGHLFGPNPERGIFRTKDGGRRFERIHFIDENTGFIDMAMDPHDPDVILAAAYQRQRRAFGFAGGGPGSGLWRTRDGGDSWERLTDGLPDGPTGRIGLAFSTRTPGRVLAIVEADGGGVFRSDDGGDTWTRLNALNPRPMYYSKLRIDPADDDRIYVLGTQLHRSNDGGQTFEIVRTEEEYGLGVHVDQHALWIDPADPDHLLLGNDGGFYYSFDRGENWTFSGNLPIQQFYDISLDMADPFNILGGLQDNNAYRGPSAVRRWQGILNGDWEVIDYGDGMFAVADPHDPDIAWVDSQGGGIVRVHLPTGDRKALQPTPRDTAERYRFDWTAPIVASRHTPGTVYLGGNRLFITRDNGITWTETEDLSRGIDRDTLRIMGVVTDSTTPSRNDGTASYGEITALSESPLDPAVLWAGTDDGNVQVSRDGGATWREVSSRVPGLPHPMMVSGIEASHESPARAYLAFDGHWDDDYRPWLFVTDDFGESWRSIAGDLPSSTVNVVREHARNPDLLFVGAADGVFVSLDRGVSWTRMNGNMPRVPVDDLELHPRDDALVAGTHGRGIWVLDDIAFLAGFTPEVAARAAHVFDIRPATLFLHRNSVPTLGQNLYRAENPAYGARIAYWLGQAGDSARIEIRDGAGNVVRTLSGDGDAGLNDVQWDLRLDPVPHDTTDFPPPSLDVGPAGPLVLPGRYTARLVAAGTTVDAPIEVRPDPLMPLTEEERRGRFDFTVALQALQRSGYFAGRQANRLDRLARETVDSLEASGTDSVTLARADSLRREIAGAAAELRRQNSALRGWWRGLIGEIDGGPSTTGTLTGPTEAQQRRRLMLEHRFEAAIQRLDAVIARVVPALNTILRGAGRPVIEVPPRVD